MDFKVELRNKIVNGDEVTFDVGMNFEGMGAPFETWDGSYDSYYDYFAFLGFSWNKTIIKDLDMSIQNNGHSTDPYHSSYPYRDEVLRTAIIQNGTLVNSKFNPNIGSVRLQWYNSSTPSTSSLQEFKLIKEGYPISDPTWQHLYTSAYSHYEPYNGGNPVYLEDGTQATGSYSHRPSFFGQSHGSTSTYHVFMKIKIVVQSGQSIPSNLRDMFYIFAQDSMPSVEFTDYESPIGSSIVGTFFMAEEASAGTGTDSGEGKVRLRLVNKQS